MKSDSYIQCTLTRLQITPGGGTQQVELVEWVAKPIAHEGRYVTCNGRWWLIAHVGQELADPRSAHDCRT